MMIGTSTMLVSPADSLVFQMLRLFIRGVTFAMELDGFGLTIFIVKVMSHRYFHALIMEWEDTTVIMVKMQGYAVKKLQVRMNDKKIKHVSLRQARKLHLTTLKMVVALCTYMQNVTLFCSHMDAGYFVKLIDSVLGVGKINDSCV